MRKKLTAFSLLALLSIIFLFPASAAPTAQQVLAKTAAVMNKSGSLVCSFSVNTGGNTITGTLKNSGKRFAVVTSSASSWYNGKNLWTYNPSSGETTLVTPTQAELAEVNPLLYVNSYSSNFTASLSKTAKAGSYDVVLTPKKRNSGIKSVIISINASDWHPTRVVVRPTSGKAVTLTVKNLRLGAKISPSEFEYPKKKYPKAEVIDLR